ncbi:MAG: hypothetical protein JSY10_20855 [Paenibacillus sp.]|nr:hypothetical protein [Paenibacillus sp.]
MISFVDDEINESGPIEADIPFDQIRKEPLPLPKDFEWCEINMEDDKEVKKKNFGSLLLVQVLMLLF